MAAVSKATSPLSSARPGRSPNSQGRASEMGKTSGSRRSGRSRGGGESWPSGMVTKAHKGDLSPGLSERKKKKKKKKVIKEPEAGKSVLNSDTYFIPSKPTSPTKNTVRGKTPEMLMKKKKKKKKDLSTPLEEPAGLETTFHRHYQSKSPRQAKSPNGTKSPRPRKQELPNGEKKKKPLWPLSMSPDSRPKSSLGSRQCEEVTKVNKKLKKYKKEKKAQDPLSWLCKSKEHPHACPERQDCEGQAAFGQKRKQGSPREYGVKMKKKKIHQEGDTTLGHSSLSKSLESSPRKRTKKKLAKVEIPECSPIGDGLCTPTKKKMKLKEKAELPEVKETSLKKKKKKMRKESIAAEQPGEEEEHRASQLSNLEPAYALWSSKSGRRICMSRAIRGTPQSSHKMLGSRCSTIKESNTDLEVVLEKKGNVDEVHIDQVRRKALQEEIDRESGKTEVPVTKKWTGTQFGQWDTADFENEEKKMKFLKLMGGFKNMPPSFRRPPNLMVRPNMALGRKASDSLQQQLMQDYDRAMSWKYNRGAGLGFSSIPNKVFYIDKNASKSTRFED
ncbi:lysine-rich nucleolar protein 1 isoform X1 [Erinaceus europaeus]|uniref:Lysine-rich nucleolar protein 1 isoform X1 n=1 Tax=Erinaceus europaeus TaxID=9365 RepID=A0ABM3VX04_ERIEU|nr:lysine-rich nucleolar protein 1 isoform X1 [Erinaceus europaeus]